MTRTGFTQEDWCHGWTATKQARVAIVGFGRMGRRHFDSCNHLSAEVTAVCEPNSARRAQAARVARVCADWKEVVQSSDVDAVVVAADTAVHPEISIAALKAGKHVLCEKPLALTLAEAQRVSAVARQSRLVFRVGYVPRYWKTAEELRGLIQDGMLGHVRKILAFNSHPSLPQDHIRAAGVIGDLAGHMIDLAQFADEHFHPLEVSAAMISRLSLPVDDGAIIHITSSCGSTLQVRTFWQARYDRRMQVWGSEARVTVDERCVRMEDLGGDLIREYSVDSQPALHRQLESFLRACQQSDAGEDKHISDALAVETVVDAARKSHELGVIVRI